VLRRVGSATALVVAFFGVAHIGSAQAQVVADPDYWKLTPERQDTVSRFVYSQSPQTIPSGYDPVREAEEILRQRQASLPASNPQAPSLWQQVRSVTVKSALSTAPRALGTVSLAAGTGWFGWKIGSGINATFLKIGWPDPGGTVSNEQLVFREQGFDIYPGYGAVLEMPFDGWLWTFYAANSTRSFWFHGAPPSCVSAVLIDPPRPEGLIDFDAGQLYCKADGFAGNPTETRVNGLVTASAMPEHELSAAGPIEPYTNQAYTRASPAPAPPPQTTVEQSIENELGKPESALLRQWLNYQLGSPGEEDPLGIGPPNAGIEFPAFQEKWEEHWQDFPDYSDPWEYWQGAVDIVERGDRAPSGGEGVLKCERTDGPLLYWDIEKATFVVVTDGKIITYFKPDNADAYWLDQCV
jgi:hypothetical protein